MKMVPGFRSILEVVVIVSCLFGILLVDCTCLQANPQQKKHTIIGAPTPPGIASAGPMGTIFADIAAKTIPTVVSVVPTKIDTVLIYNNPFFNFFGDTSQNNPFNFFFGVPHGKKGVPPPKKEERREQALGAGVIISSDGLILSNNHVVQGASQIEVRLSDGRHYAATIVGTDSLSDIAVIKIKEKVSNLPTAYFGNSDSLRPGDWVMAAGNPFALLSTVTIGVVSALNRQVESPDMYENFIQTDAAINPGNSGGALVNIRGELVGINTLIFTETGGFMGIGFAIPINMARFEAEEIVATGRVTRGYIGISVQNISPSAQKALDLSDNKGALVADVVKGQPADKAGIHTGDVIISIDNRAVVDGNDLRNRVAEIAPGKTVPVIVIRHGKKMDLSITIAERTPQRVAAAEEKPPAQMKPASAFGIDITAMTDQLRHNYSIPQNVSGVVVTGVRASVDDERLNLRPGDVITSIKIDGGDFQVVRTVDQLETIAGHTKSDTPVILLVARGNNTFFVAF